MIDGLRRSPNAVDHLMINGRCATCGRGPHADWPLLPYPPHALTRRTRAWRRLAGWARRARATICRPGPHRTCA